jgi:hypothetical protein
MKKMRFIILLSLFLFAQGVIASGKRDISVAAGECAGLMMFAGDRVMAEVAFERTKNFKRTKFALKKAYKGLGVLTELSADKAKVFVVARYLRSCKKLGINAAYLLKIKDEYSIALNETSSLFRQQKNGLVKPG